MYWNEIAHATVTEVLAININMRCIEIPYRSGERGSNEKININMRCIEIFLA